MKPGDLMLNSLDGLCIFLSEERRPPRVKWYDNLCRVWVFIQGEIDYFEFHRLKGDERPIEDIVPRTVTIISRIDDAVS